MVFVPGPTPPSGRRPTNFPWILTNDSLGEDLGQFATGGLVLVAKAAATLLIGDAVFWSAAGTVNKSTVAGDRLKKCGIVIGGVPRGVQDYTLEALQSSLDIGEQAALVNQAVLVCWHGICLAVATGAISAGALVTFSAATSGRVVVSPAASAADAMGALGTAVDASAADADLLRILVSY